MIATVQHLGGFDVSESYKNSVNYINSYLRRHPSVYRTVMNLVENKIEAKPAKPDKQIAEPVRIPDSVKAKIADELRAGKTNSQISSEYGVSKCSVTKIRVKAGIPSKVVWGQGMTLEEKKARARERYAARKSVSLTR